MPRQVAVWCAINLLGSSGASVACGTSFSTQLHGFLRMVEGLYSMRKLSDVSAVSAAQLLDQAAVSSLQQVDNLALSSEAGLGATDVQFRSIVKDIEMIRVAAQWVTSKLELRNAGAGVR